MSDIIKKIVCFFIGHNPKYAHETKRNDGCCIRCEASLMGGKWVGK